MFRIFLDVFYILQDQIYQLMISRRFSSLAFKTVPSEEPISVLIASIGNPEKGYKNTRHSVGHYILQKIALQNGWSIGKRENQQLFLFQSPSYMNVSGLKIRDVWHKVMQESRAGGFNPALIIIHDELDTELGKIKIRKQGASTRGHNGLKSIQKYIGKGYTTISIGISRPESRDPETVSNYVLGKFKPQELEILNEQVVPKVETAIRQILENGKFVTD
ncbi:unnamed protein product [Kuraishia capsulata CBS 1993]|uniref:peptidyl-tRNA hydrolase n=1 Tax=Kuraishia capsulata CBS 1993 TaxID=1382522 RepID=W6MMA2_9ASCO|nr:uncharacterized protein KUCA_T00003683001 [Kuraishia capsulata CBS 1993]CDK27704.1 unnamed protein product [Kuraishia capsulata CBS 1993]